MEEADFILKSALNGDIKAFQQLFGVFQKELRSYLYRLLTDRNDAEDLTHDTFIRAFDKLATFQGTSSLKTWVFQIATHLAYDHLRHDQRWRVDAQDQAKALASARADIQHAFQFTHLTAASGAYDIREHIDFCFTCIAKTLLIEQQVTLLLKDVYDFSVKEIAQILHKTEGVVKHGLVDARRTMREIFAGRCALVNKNGICHQCTELNRIYNPRQHQQTELMKLELVRAAPSATQEKLYQLRSALVRNIDPLRSEGADLQDALMQCTRQAIGEIHAFVPP